VPKPAAQEVEELLGLEVGLELLDAVRQTIVEAARCDVVVGEFAAVDAVAVAVAVGIAAAAGVAVAVAVVAAGAVAAGVVEEDVGHLGEEVALGCFVVVGEELLAPASGTKAAGEARHFDSDFDFAGSWVEVFEMGVEGFGDEIEGSEAAASDAVEDFVLDRAVQSFHLPVLRALEVAASVVQSPPGDSVHLDSEASFE
jgi:hypothetical protein